MADRAPTLSILIPAYDEADTIVEVLRRILAVDAAALGHVFEVIVCDDGSRDETAARVAAFAAAHPEVRLVSHPRNAGKGAAIRTALAHARGEHVLVQDADLEYDVADYPALLAPLRDGVEAVFGSRFLQARWPAGMRVPNFVANKLLTTAANLLFDARLTDEATCYKCVRTERLRALGLRCQRFEFCPELIGKLRLAGVDLHEVPVAYRGRGVAGGKKVRARDAFTAMWTLLSVWLGAERRGLLVVALACALFSLVHAGYAAWWSDVTWDEPAHLGWAARLWHTGVTERRSRQDYDSKTPILVPHVAFASALGARVTTPMTRRSIFLHRVPTVVALAVLYLATFFAGRRAFGPDAGPLATILVACDPNLVAHGALATVDLPFALATLLALGAAIHFYRAPSAARALVAGALLGLSLITKFSAILLVPLCLIGPPLCGVRPPAQRLLTDRLLGHLALAAAAAWLVIAAGYGFHGLGHAAAAYAYQTAPFQALARAAPSLLAPFPVDFLSGVDVCLREDQGTAWNVVVLGRHYPHGVWFYFPVVWAMKTPVALVAAALVGAALALRAGLLRQPTARALALGFAALLLYFCLVFKTMKGLRYALMCLPLAYLLAAHGLRGARTAAVAVGAALALYGQLPYLGNALAYTTELLRDKAAVAGYLTDSNIDWLQTRRAVTAWARAHDAVVDPPHLVAGINLVGVNTWTGVVGDQAVRPDGYLPQRARRPDGVVAFTHLRFDVGADEFERILDRQRRTVGLERCPLEDAAPIVLAAGQRRAIPIGVSVCLTPEGLADVSIGAEVDEAAVAVRRADGQRRLAVDEVGRGHASWHRLEARPLVLHTRGGPFVLRVARGRVAVRVGAPTMRVDPAAEGCAGGVEVRAPAGERARLHAVGELDGWRAWSSNRLRWADGCYVGELTLPGGRHHMKIAGPDWSTGQGYGIFGRAWTDAARPVTPDDPAPLIVETSDAPTSDVLVEVPTAGRYRLVLRVDGSTARLTLRRAIAATAPRRGEVAGSSTPATPR